MPDYRQVSKDACIELIINKSRFLGYVYQVQNAEHAESLLSALRKPHSTATHICYGYIADVLGNVGRFSDDGEPQGTAGLPILDVIKKQELRLTLVAVVRYFGGVKLGAGGLVRAYSQTAALAIESAGVTVVKERVRLGLNLDYSDHTRMSGLLSGTGITIEDRIFGGQVELMLSIDKALYEGFLESLSSFLGVGRERLLQDTVKVITS